jgi:hypothetical protein
MSRRVNLTGVLTLSNGLVVSESVVSQVEASVSCIDWIRSVKGDERVILLESIQGETRLWTITRAFVLRPDCLNIIGHFTGYCKLGCIGCLSRSHCNTTISIATVNLAVMELNAAVRTS